MNKMSNVQQEVASLKFYVDDEKKKTSFFLVFIFNGIVILADVTWKYNHIAETICWKQIIYVNPLHSQKKTNWHLILSF